MSAPARSLYLLVGLALANLGGGIAQAAYYAYDLGGLAQAQRCMAEQRVSVGVATSDLDSVARTAACAAAINYRQGIAMLVGAVAMLVVAWLLTLLGGYEARRRVRGLSAPEGVAATGRFEAWCDGLGLAGRRRPRLVLAPPSTGIFTAFTVALPWSRPVVVIPLNSVVAGGAFDVLALHELAHVRARDPVWAASVWWTGWLVLPAFLIGLGPFLSRPQVLLALYGSSLWLVVALAVGALLLRSALLRRRELLADRFAMDVLGDGVRLGDEQEPRRRFAVVRAVFATHPRAAARFKAGAGGPGRRVGGFLFSATAGFLTMYTAQSMYVVLSNLWRTAGGVALTASIAAASLLWAAIAVPAWARRGRFEAVLGTAAGLGLGVYLQIPGLPATGLAIGTEGPLAGAVSVAVVGAGLGALTIGLAQAAGSRRPATAVAVALASVTFTVIVTMILLASAATTAAVQRQLIFGGSGPALSGWFLLVPVLLGSLSAGVPRRAVAATATATVVGATAAAGWWLLRLPQASSGDAAFHLFGQRMWSCAFAGLSVVAVLLAGTPHRKSAMPGALFAGFATAAGAGLLSLAGGAVAGVGLNVGNLVTSVRQPMWLLLVALVVTLPWLLAAAAVADKLRRRPGTVVSTAAVAGVLLLALLSGALAPVTTARGDYDAGQEAAQALHRPAGAPRTVPPVLQPAAGPARTADPGRPLDRHAATAAVDAVGAMLPPDHRTIETPTDGGAEFSPPSCGELVSRNDRAERLLPRTAEVARTYEMDLSGAVGGRLTLYVGVASYTRPVRDFAPQLDELSRCRRMRVRSDFADSGWLDVTYTGGLSAGCLSTRFASVATASRVPVEVHVYAETLLIGHNRITARVSFAYAAIPPPGPVQTAGAALSRAAAQSALDNLRR